jgi:hypothetical protein
MSMFPAVAVGVGVLVRDMVVLMRGVRMCMGLFPVLVFVRMWCLMGVRLGHNCHLLVRNMLWLLVFRPTPQ